MEDKNRASTANVPQDTDEGTNDNPVHPIPGATIHSSADQIPVLIEVLFGLKPVAGVSYEISGCL
jgi:hypothetical protein